MPYAVTTDIDHAITLLSGCESLASQYNTTSRMVPKTYAGGSAKKDGDKKND